MNKKRSIHELYLDTFLPEAAMPEDHFFNLTWTYMLPERHYHNLDHIQDMLNNLIDFQERDMSYNKYNFNALKKAIWIHDVICLPGSKTNEEDSVLWAKLHQYHLLFNDFDVIEKLVMATKTHQSNDINEQLIVDLDLYGLSTSDYQSNGEKIRKEFSEFSDKEFYEGRKKWLESFIARPKIYLNEDFSTPEMEQLAHYNMTNELDNVKFKLIEMTLTEA